MTVMSKSTVRVVGLAKTLTQKMVSKCTLTLECSMRRKNSITCGDDLVKMLTQNGVETRTDAGMSDMSKSTTRVDGLAKTLTQMMASKRALTLECTMCRKKVLYAAIA